jgi:glyoxylase-like metal-dependent hydrolase (beta-lactamase superfamily II)
MIETSLFEEVTQIRMSREISGKPVYWVAAYLVDGLLIDTGCNFTASELAAFLDGRPLHQIVNTHFHEDHIGGNRLLQEKFGIEILAPADSVPLIAREAKLFPYQEMVWGYPAPSETRPLPAVIRTERYTFDVIDTPGHSAGHVALVEKSLGCRASWLGREVGLCVLQGRVVDAYPGIGPRAVAVQYQRE